MSEKFFKLAGCLRADYLNVGVLYYAAEKHPEMKEAVTSNLQTQILALWHDRLLRIKSADKFRSLVNLRLCCGLAFNKGAAKNLYLFWANIIGMVPPT